MMFGPNIVVEFIWTKVIFFDEITSFELLKLSVLREYIVWLRACEVSINVILKPYFADMSESVRFCINLAE
jgi:hypothetical protein